MALDDLTDDVAASYSDLGETVEVTLDAETRNELAMLRTVTGSDTDELLHRAVHQLFQATLDTGRIDFLLRSTYDTTYDEYLAGMTYGEMTGQPSPPEDDDRRYQF